MREGDRPTGPRSALRLLPYLPREVGAMLTDAQIYRAAEAAINDSKAAQSGYFSGPATPVYLAVREAIQAFLYPTPTPTEDH